VTALPTLSQLDGATTTRIWLATQPADMRCGFDRLAELARVVTGQDPLSGHLFLFRGRGGDRLKILYWDKDGFALWYKRLEEGTFKWPRTVSPASPGPAASAASVELRGSELAMILDGIDLSSVKRGKRYRRSNANPER
jgi:transposase